MIAAILFAVGEFLAWSFAAGGVLLGLIGAFGAVRHFNSGRRMTPR